MKRILVVSFILLSFFCCTQKPVLPEGEIPITTSSDEALQLFFEGRELNENLKSPQAAELFDKAIALDSDFAKAYLYRAFSGGGYKVFRGNLDKAVALVDKISEGEKHQILYAQANADNDGAKQKMHLDKMLELFPEDKRVHDIAGNYFYYNPQDYEKALMHYKKAVELDSSFAPSYNSMGYLLRDMENYTESETAFQKYIEIIPDEANPYDSYAEFLIEQGRFDESITQYQMAFDMDNEYVMAFVGIGDNYVFKEEFDKARENYQKSFDMAFNLNQKMSALFWEAVSYVHEENLDKAVETFQKRVDLAMENASPNFVVFSHLPTMYFLTEAGQFDKGEAFLDKADAFIETAELKEADRKSYKLYAGLDRCYFNIMKGELEKAESDVQTWMQLVEERKNPDEKQFLHMILGILETKKNNFDGALEHFGNADLENPYIWYWKAIALEKSGDGEQAMKMYSKVTNSYRNGIGLAVILIKAEKKVR
jgi:tetratricopeptide (TPR) repeat protein